MHPTRWSSVLVAAVAMASVSLPRAQQPGAAAPQPAAPSAYNERLTRTLEEKAKQATVTQTKSIPTMRGSVTVTTQVGSNQTNAAVMGQILIRDTYVAQLNGTADRIEKLLNDPAQLDTLVRALRQDAAAVDSAHRNMLAAEQAVITVQERNPRADQELAYQADMRAAQQLEQKGDTAGAEAARQRARDTAYGNYVERRQEFFETLDRNPLLGLGERNMFLPDDFLFKALRNELPWNAPNSEYVDLARPYLERAAQEARAEATRAAGVTSVDGLAEFGGPKYDRTRQAAAAAGQREGSDLPRQLGEAAAGAYEAAEGGRAVQTEITNFGLNLVAGGAWVIPGVGPLIAGGAAAIQVVREGNDLVVAVLDAEDARNLAGTTGYTRIITAEDRVAAERGDFALALGGLALEGLSAVRVVKGPVVPGRGGPSAPSAPAATPPAAATTPTPAPRAAAAVEPPPAAVAGAAAGARRSAGTFEEVAQRAREQAKKYGVDESRVDEWLQAAKEDPKTWGVFANRLQNPMTEASNFLSNLADLDDMVTGALARGVPKNQVDEAVRAAVDRANQGATDAFQDLRGNLRTLEMNAQGRALFLPREFTKAFDAVSPDVRPGSVVNADAGALRQLDVRVRALARGTIDELTPEELATLKALEQYGDDIYKWLSFDGMVDVDPVFSPGFREQVAKAFPDGVPDPPAGTRPTTALPASPAAAGSDAVKRPDSPPGNIDPAAAQDALKTQILPNAKPAGPPAAPAVDPGATTRIVPDLTILTPPRAAVAGAGMAAGAAGMSSASAAEPGAATATGVLEAGSAPVSRELMRIYFPISPLTEDERRRRTVLDWTETPYVDAAIPTAANARDPLVQLMMVELRLQVRPGGGAASPPATARPPRDLAWLGRSLWQVLQAPFRRPVVPAAMLGAVDRAPVGALRPAPRATRGDSTQPRVTSPVRAFLKSLGTSTGEAFELHVLNEGGAPLDLSADGLVVEPLTRAAQQEAQRQITQLASKNPVTARINAYCLEFLRQPPSMGTIFRIASPDLQAQFAPLRQVLKAAQRLEAAGLLKADGGSPIDYAHSIKQWAVWAREQNFSLEGFTRAFLEHAKKNVAAAGQPWTPQLEKGFEGLVPHRWSHITAVLAEAAVR